MKPKYHSIFSRLCLLVGLFMLAGAICAQEFPKDLTQEWIQARLVSQKPRIIFTPTVEAQLRTQLKTNEAVQVFYEKVKDYADRMLSTPPLERKMRGRRLLSVSREAITRTNALAMAYRIEKDAKYLERLELELTTICNFSDWNPDHFLDVAEMAVAVSLPLDWLDQELSASTKQLIREALVEKAFKPSLDANRKSNWWWNAHHNWNLVCHGGLAVAALAIFEEEPALTSAILDRTYKKFPMGFKPYYPDGAYYEGPSYWFYATNYFALTLSAFESTLGTDFNFIEGPGIKESAVFTEVTAGPSGNYFNYFDAGLGGYRNISHVGLLAWFSPRIGNNFLGDEDKAEKIQAQKAKKNIDRFTPLHTLFLAQLPADLPPVKLPKAWLAGGDSPVGVFRPEDENGIYLAAKGGSAYDNHGNMDAGSFILEWKKIRWSVDPGNQDYTALEATIGTGNLWNRSQDSERWKLLTKNNFGHSTLSINEAQHEVKARALIQESNLENQPPDFSFDLSPLFGANVEQAVRTFQKIDDQQIRIQDQIQINEKTELIHWQFISTAAIEIQDEGILLSQDGEKLWLEMECSQDYEVQVVQLDPPPLSYDKRIRGLKRLDFIVKPNLANGKKVNITVDFIGK